MTILEIILLVLFLITLITLYITILFYEFILNKQYNETIENIIKRKKDF